MDKKTFGFNMRLDLIDDVFCISWPGRHKGLNFWITVDLLFEFNAVTCNTLAVAYRRLIFFVVL